MLKKTTSTTLQRGTRAVALISSLQPPVPCTEKHWLLSLKMVLKKPVYQYERGAKIDTIISIYTAYSAIKGEKNEYHPATKTYWIRQT
jgi:hypothetical protein